MAVKIGTVNTFPNVEPDKEQALKILEESAEVFGAWQEWSYWNGRIDISENEYAAAVRAHDAKGYLCEECADLVTAVSNLLAALGVTNLYEWLQVVEGKNRDRGHYDERGYYDR